MAYSNLVNRKTFMRYTRTSFNRAPTAYRNARDIIHFVNYLAGRIGADSSKIDFDRFCELVGDWEPREVSTLAAWLKEQVGRLAFESNQSVANFIISAARM